MSFNTLTLSIVIPVYNEENHLKSCLDSIAAQTVMPLQVLVVDNNSTDKTIEVASTYDFVTILSETRQHQSFAQVTGFKSVQADITGRIDADAILPKNWVENVLLYMSVHEEVIAVTGNEKAYDVPLKKFGTWIFVLYHQHFSRLASGHEMLWGSNCAMRTSAIKKIQDKLLQRGDIWEDYDMSFCLAPLGKIKRISTITIQNSFRAGHKPLIPLVTYQIRAIRTFWLRTVWWRAIIFTVLWSTLALVYPIPLLDRFLLFLQNRQSSNK
jgi:glycosyltransferase involved in cell wall biosynthesis